MHLADQPGNKLLIALACACCLTGVAVVIPIGDAREKAVAMPHQAGNTPEESGGVVERGVQRTAVEPDAHSTAEGRDPKKPTARYRSRRGKS